MPTMTVPSAAMRRLRREGLEISRRRAALVPTGGVAVAKKPSPPPQHTYVLALPAPLPRSNPAPCAASSRSHRTAAPTAEPAEVSSSKCIGKGAQVRVRTRVGTARSTGQPIVFWLRAVVDSAADMDGYLHVTYSYTNGKLPRVARVAPRDIIRLHDVPTPAAVLRPPVVLQPSPATALRARHGRIRLLPPPRPTVAGKKLPLLKKFEKEMKSRSKTITGCW
ncbi:hypothetical protein SETIT_2G330300v2 [Setaria italica]|uniref:Uncharacterized protein n=1 Tax=Setaria italica TaxID=4555 RepID=A0A368Q5M1_SETIT|nr:hypothetical protein SETIT_2G330300v2 [Setaria italica]